MKVNYCIKASFSMKVVDDLCRQLIDLRNQINYVHESGRKGSWVKEGKLCNKFIDVLSELVDYVVDIDEAYYVPDIHEDALQDS